MSLNQFENALVDFLLNVNAQDEFRSCKLEIRLMNIIRKVSIEQIEDVIQILYKCITQLEKMKNLKIKYNIGECKCMSFI